MYAIIVSSIVFALVHVLLPTKILALILGIILGICYIRTKSIFMCILIHSLYNFSNRFT
jgi:membrane protease YdiL (CAAX protease family)